MGIRHAFRSKATRSAIESERELGGALITTSQIMLKFPGYINRTKLISYREAISARQPSSFILRTHITHCRSFHSRCVPINNPHSERSRSSRYSNSDLATRFKVFMPLKNFGLFVQLTWHCAKVFSFEDSLFFMIKA